jgi:SCF-associated factor 1
VDLQCGGWSTTVLTSEGKAYTLGILDASDGRNVGEIARDFTRLEYLSQSTSALRQLSVGRRHVLALNDNGEILTWDRVNAKGYKVFARAARDFGGEPKRVVAGWGDSSVYVPETGIIYWQPVKNDQDQMLDGLHVKEKIIPNTARRIQRVSEKDVVIEVLRHIVLEGWIVYITSRSQIFACAIEATDPEQTEPTALPFEVPGYACEGRELKDVQGSFRSFVVFTASGEVLAGNVDYLRRCSIGRQNTAADSAPTEEMQEALLASRPPDIPAMQNTGVIEVAFGDYHYHALHSNGTVTSYGTEAQCYGSLGLGDVNAGSWFRGVAKLGQGGWRADAKLLPIANIRGRQVWFEPEKKVWLRWMQDHKTDAHQNLSQSIYSEWVEQEGRHWAEGPVTTRKSLPKWGSSGQQQAPQQIEAQNYENLGAYFVISLAAAGWHSGALVLVDEVKSEEVRQKWMVTRRAPPVPGEFEASEEPHEEYVWVGQKTLPKIQLTPGSGQFLEGDLQPWRDGIPTMQEMGLELGTFSGR